MSKQDVIIEMDSATKTELFNKLEGLSNIKWDEGVAKFLFRVKALAQLRLTEKGHIVTSRLKNSIYVQMPKQSQANKIGREMGVQNSKRYRYKGGSDSSVLTSVNLGINEGAVGTNVEYAGVIERGGPAHVITPKNKKVLSWIPKSIGQAWFSTKTRSSLKNIYLDSSGKNTLKNERVFASKVNHPGFSGDSFLYWASRNSQKDIGDYFREIASKNIKKISVKRYRP